MFNEKKKESSRKAALEASEDVLKLEREHGVRRQVGSLAGRVPELFFRRTAIRDRVRRNRELPVTGALCCHSVLHLFIKSRGVGEVIFLCVATEEDRTGIGMCLHRSNGNFGSALDRIPMHPAADARKSAGLEALCLCNIQG